MEFENTTTPEDRARNKLRFTIVDEVRPPLDIVRMYMDSIYEKISPWTHLYHAIHGAARIEIDTWKTEADFMHHVRVTRFSLGGEWKQYNISEMEVARVPQEELFFIVDKLVKELFQPIIDLPWEDYLWPVEPKTRREVIEEMLKMGLMSVNEFRAAEGIIDAAGVGRASGESEAPTSIR